MPKKMTDPAPVELLQIGEAARMAGVSIRTVRFYEETGLLLPSQSTSGGIRLYMSRDVNRLVFIKRMKMLGMSIEEIKVCLGVVDTSSTKHMRVEETIRVLRMQKEKLDELVGMILEAKGEVEISIDRLGKCKRCTNDACPIACPNRQLIL
jgi:MerR family Zn(II)-responsive transcriptional regulator of zntA